MIREHRCKNNWATRKQGKDSRRIDTLLQTSDTFRKKADRAWAKALNGGGGHNYQNARSYYDTSRKALEALEALDPSMEIKVG